MTNSTAEFDAFAANYDLALEQGLSLTGESKDYFAEARLRWLRSRLAKFDAASTAILDFGCGTGSSVPWFLDLLEAKRIVGSDVSTQSLEVARERWQDYDTEFVPCGSE
ncbi:MAG: methyltransferase domain-containing protein, partial [Planctomycetota bacterium]